VKTLNDYAPAIRQQLARVKLVLMDVDGVLTNGLIYLSDEGVETKAFSTRDGLAIVWFRRYGLRTGVISGRHSKGTEQRCRDLQIDEVHLGATHKAPVLEEIMGRLGLRGEEIAFVGDDLLDLPVMQRVGVSAAPCDAHAEVLSRVDIVLDCPGGKGAVRHFLDLWLMATGKLNTAIEDILHDQF